MDLLTNSTADSVPQSRTLQELLAPRSVRFFSREGTELGDKASLGVRIHKISGIATSALRGTPLHEFSIEERLSWAKSRKTTRKEDRVYSLLGMFGIYLLPNYGEGVDYAFKRFHRELDASFKDRLRQQAIEHAFETTGGARDDTQGTWLVPLQRPKAFVGRDSQLTQLRAHVASESDQRLAIYGLGGCGKTALALELVYWTKMQQPTCKIFWVSALSRESFEHAYHEIGKLLSIPGLDDNDADVMRLVAARLSSGEIGSWLMVVDNADDESILFSDAREVKDSEQLIDYLPQCHKGSIIFTTRNRVAALKLAKSNVLALVDLEKEEALELLGKRLTHEHRDQLQDHEIVEQFFDMLSCHALAIVQAAAFIEKNSVTLSNYIALYKGSEKDAIDLLGEDFEDQTRYEVATNAVATTWYISFRQIQAQDPIAAEHLFFMACTASNDIDPFVFPPEYTKTEHIKAIGTLKAYAFVTHRVRQTQKSWGKAIHIETIDVHPLVHLAISGWLKANHQWDLWLEIALTRFNKIVPRGDHSSKDYWATYLHHAVHVANLPEAQETEGRVKLLERIARCERSLGHFKVAERIYRQAYERRLEMYGREHPDTLDAMRNITAILGDQGRWVEAEKLHIENLRLAVRALGDEHIQTLTIKHDLGLALCGLWRWQEAETLFRELLQKDHVFEANDVTPGNTLQNLGATLSQQGRDAEAEAIFRETYAIRKARVGEDDISTLSSLSALGTALSRLTRYTEAETCHRDLLAQRTKVLGYDHPLTLKSMNHLAVDLDMQLKHTEAEQLRRTALAITEKIHGPDALDTLECMTAVAQSLRSQEKNQEAEDLHRICLARMQKVLGEDHNLTLMTLYWLANIARFAERHKEAQALYQRAFEGMKRAWGEENQTTKECGELIDWMGWLADGHKRAQMHFEPGSDAEAGAVDKKARQKKWRERVRNMVKKS
ncbi:hypothetical protein HBI38_006430 [Parastagonospora nodorum]|nr:hypothetical protein HBI73_005780 [Parastagonospora nodorum]KAH6048923.1 hypothetical protein HBI67_220940 [Parastagonospora nodorum]KAH6086818.1 hypothetical protein HBI66_037600 [Parastagonospora nodorum]KAH6333102.1 hypothetical protein HBI38_006430 [Parastagonospora nodorum]